MWHVKKVILIFQTDIEHSNNVKSDGFMSADRLILQKKNCVKGWRRFFYNLFNNSVSKEECLWIQLQIFQSHFCNLELLECHVHLLSLCNGTEEKPSFMAFCEHLIQRIGSESRFLYAQRSRHNRAEVMLAVQGHKSKVQQPFESVTLIWPSTTSVARSGWRFPAQKLTKTRPLQQKPAQNFNCPNNVIWFYYHVNQD